MDELAFRERLAGIEREAWSCGDICMAITCREARCGDAEATEAISDHFGFDIRMGVTEA